MEGGEGVEPERRGEGQQLKKARSKIHRVSPGFNTCLKVPFQVSVFKRHFAIVRLPTSLFLSKETPAAEWR
jgi:hypothetical protein